jgi:hypothetical protein
LISFFFFKEINRAPGIIGSDYTKKLEIANRHWCGTGTLPDIQTAVI